MKVLFPGSDFVAQVNILGPFWGLSLYILSELSMRYIAYMWVSMKFFATGFGDMKFYF